MEIIDISNSELNTDWIKTPENRRTEEEIHEALAEEIKKEPVIVEEEE